MQAASPVYTAAVSDPTTRRSQTISHQTPAHAYHTGGSCGTQPIHGTPKSRPNPASHDRERTASITEARVLPQTTALHSYVWGFYVIFLIRRDNLLQRWVH